MSLSTKFVFVSGGLFAVVVIVGLLTGASPALLGVTVFAGLVCAGWLYLDLEPIGRITETLEQVAQGKTDRPTISEDGSEPIRRLASATNALKNQFEDSLSRARDLASGKVGVVNVEERVLRTGALSDADEPSTSSGGPLETTMIELSNQMRRLTIQARVISKDQLSSSLLDDRVPGELGDAFALMVRNLRALTERARDIADGDLTRRVEGDGDLTRAFNQMVDRLHGLAEDITRTAIHITSSSEQILAVLREQEFAASHQASGVEETQRTMETLLSSAKRIAESAQTVFKSAEKTQANNRNVAERIAELKAHTERIGEILEVIKSIADRSDLLALNASLEGMRAGEAGKGFTLVAAEMRRLAESIKESVGDIKELLSDIRESALSSVMATEEGSNLSERTTESALKITLITQQQQSGTEQVTQSMDELSTLINQGVAGMRQVTSAADELVNTSDSLQTIVEQFELEMDTPSTATKSAERRRRRRPRRRAGATDSATFERVQPAAHLAAPPSTVVDADEGRDGEGRDGEETPAMADLETREAGRTAGGRRNTMSFWDDRSTDGLGAGDSQASSAGLELSSVVEDEPVDDVEDPPTVELTGLSEEEEREMLAEALRTSTQKLNAVGEDQHDGEDQEE